MGSVKDSADALMAENAELKQTIASLKEEIVSMKQKILTLQHEANKPQNHAVLPKEQLSDEAEKILMFLNAHRDVNAKQVAHYTSLEYKKADYWLKELVRGHMIIATLSIGSPTTYTIGQSGREYLINNNMI